MNRKFSYEYRILQYLHDPVCQESLNVGIVLICPSQKFLSCIVKKKSGRISKSFPGLDRASLLSGLRTIEAGINTLSISVKDQLLEASFFENGILKLSNSVLPFDGSSLRWSAPRTGITSCSERTLNSLFERFVSRYDKDMAGGRDDSEIWKPVRNRLESLGLSNKLTSKMIISSLDEVEFSHAYKNGVWHCYQPLSFDLTSSGNISEKAARWAGHMLGIARSAEKVRPYFIVGEPSRPELRKPYERAIQLLRASELSPKVFEESETDELVSIIENTIVHSNLSQ